jgi:lactoylglutathione lyase
LVSGTTSRLKRFRVRPLSSASHASADSQLTARTDRHRGSRYGVFMRRVDYVIHYVESLRRSVTFYRDVIGLQVRIEGDGYVEFEMDNTKFSLFDRSKLPGLIGREGGHPPCGEIGFLIEDVDGEAERLTGLGVEILSGPVDRPWHERTLHIADPDGNIIEFAQKLR